MTEFIHGDCIAALRAEITAAFAEVPMPSSDEIVSCGCLECHEVQQTYNGKRWDEVAAAQEAFGLSSALALLAKPAYRYYLPGFLIEALARSPAINTDFVIYSVCPDSQERWLDRFAFFTKEQQAAVGRWVLCLLRYRAWFQIDELSCQAGYRRYWKAILKESLRAVRSSGGPS